MSGGRWHGALNAICAANELRDEWPCGQNWAYAGVYPTSLDTDSAIVTEVQKALTELGASPVLVYRAAAMLPAALYEEFVRLEADPHLLAIVGSWGDTMSDDEVLDALRHWNAGTFELDLLDTTGRTAEIRARQPKRRPKPKAH